jgi:hypothetical protein
MLYLLVHEHAQCARDDFVDKCAECAQVGSRTSGQADDGTESFSRLDKRLVKPTLVRLADCNGSVSQHGVDIKRAR